MGKLKFLIVPLSVVFGLLVVFMVGVIIFMNTAPQFGAVPAGSDLERIQNSPNYGSEAFENLIETKMDMGFIKGLSLLPMMISNPNQTAPLDPLPTRFGLGNKTDSDSLVYVTWYGHSAFLIEFEGKRILLDPMLGPASSPVSFITKRFRYEERIKLENIKNIDAIVISHDHYDHLDFKSIKQLLPHTEKIYTALGVGSHLKRWGVPPSKIVELDWWSDSALENLTLTATPSRHFSGRTFSDRNKTQWASWVIEGKYNKIYFSGDSGYGPHFKSIGQKIGPFDFAMVECGQYNENWASIHMMPEQSAQVGLDLDAKVIMPIHWSGFDLSLHSWTDPIERVAEAAKNLSQPIVHPRIGLRFEISEMPNDRWWETVN